NREQEISYISRSLKSLAKELEIPIIALSQLSRDVEKRGGPKRPQLSDLRESGAIEQDADLVLFVYRPGYYGNEDVETPQDTAEILIAKHRNGRIGDISLRFKREIVKFVEFEPSHQDFAQMESDILDETKTIIRPSKMNDIEEEGPF